MLGFTVTTLSLTFTLVAWNALVALVHPGPVTAVSPHPHLDALMTVLRQVDVKTAVLTVINFKPYQFLVGLIVFLDLRRVMYRFFDKDIQRRGN